MVLLVGLPLLPDFPDWAAAFLGKLNKKQTLKRSDLKGPDFYFKSPGVSFTGTDLSILSLSCIPTAHSQDGLLSASSKTVVMRHQQL